VAGTGKTHFAGKSLLTLIEAVARPSPTAPPSSDAPDASVGPCLRVLVTAFTHTAIDNLLQRVATLAHRAKAIPNRQVPTPTSGSPNKSLIERD
jgi:hypothetical protein